MNPPAHVALALTLLALPACGGDGGGSESSEGSSTAPVTTTDASTTASGSSSTDAPPTTSGDSATGTGGSSSTGDPFGGGSVCSRGLEWTMGNTESPFMNPGMACRTCHAALEPALSNRILIGGTVYETGHEPDLCLGIDGVTDPMVVEITDATMKVTELTVNQSGNFLWDNSVHGGLTFPITARVVRGDQERVMFSPQMDGDCNACHTENGMNGAPGRIVAP